MCRIYWTLELQHAGAVRTFQAYTCIALPLPFKMLMDHYQEVNMAPYQSILGAHIVWFMLIGNKKHIQSIACSSPEKLKKKKPRLRPAWLGFHVGGGVCCDVYEHLFIIVWVCRWEPVKWLLHDDTQKLDVRGSVHHGSVHIQLKVQLCVHVFTYIFILYFCLVLALHVSGAICTHPQDHKLHLQP
jgi:hypothetical protein